VEDIGLRSTRIRTPDRTIISVPNAQFASLSLENYAPREKMWFHPVLKLRFDTTSSQLSEILRNSRRLFEEDSKLEAGARIRLVGMGSSSIDLEVYAYVLTADSDQFLAIQEELLLKLLAIVESAGAAMAAPNQIAYIAAREGTPVRTPHQRAIQDGQRR
jgi:MscS family membrane protein